MKKNLGLNTTASLYDTQRINNFEKELEEMKNCVNEINNLEKNIQEEVVRQAYPLPQKFEDQNRQS